MKQYIGVDLGGTNLRAVRIDRQGHIYQRLNTTTAAKAGPDAIVDQMTQLIEQVIGDVPRAHIAGVGVGSPGPLDPFAGIVLQAPNLRGWVNVPLRAMLQERIMLPVVLNNDGNAATLGEWRLGSGQGYKDFIYISIGTGLGGGIITNNQLLIGRKGMGGEVGHMQITPDGPVCSCGAVGCWESFTSGSALTRFAVQALQTGRASRLKECLASGSITVSEIFKTAEEGDVLALELLRKEGEYLGRGLVGLLHLFSPERIALGGGVACGMKWFEESMFQVIQERAMPSFHDVPIQYAQLGEHAGVIGAATLLFEPAMIRI